MVTENKASYYTTEMFQEAEEAIQKEVQRILNEKEEEMQKEREQIKRKHEEEMQEMRRKMEEQRADPDAPPVHVPVLSGPPPSLASISCYQFSPVEGSTCLSGSALFPYSHGTAPGTAEATAKVDVWEKDKEMKGGGQYK
ncbi:hypothetical protein Q8A73_011334 [Channa argus]|nr:hypothetical protein Q8A73_011334 [Channa argus]